MKENEEVFLENRKDKSGSAIKTALIIVSIAAFLAGMAAAVILMFKKIASAMEKVNGGVKYDPIEDEDLTSTDALDGEEDEQPSAEDEAPEDDPDEPAEETPAEE